MLDSERLRAEQAVCDASLAEAGEGLEHLQLEFPGLDGMLRGKIVAAAKGMSASGMGLSSLTYSLIGGDNVALTPWSDVDSGFPKFVATPDPATLVRWGWREGIGAVLFDSVMPDGAPCGLDVRRTVRRLSDELAQRGFTANVAYELEFYVFHADDTLLAQGRHHELRPFGRSWDAYSLARFPEWQDLGREFTRRMASVGVSVEAFHTELGYGMYEFALSPAAPLAAADGAARARLYLRQLCAEQGLVCTFMPKWRADRGDSGSGAHFHLSLARDGENVTWDAERQDLSQPGTQALAGMLATMPELHAFFRPLVNSYRRMDAGSWNPEDASWGYDNHIAAVRAITGPTPRHVHFEHRTSGADASPYLAIASLLTGVLHGLDQSLEPLPPCRGDPTAGGAYPRLPADLRASVAALRESAVARRWLGDLLVDHFCDTRERECADYEAWARTQVSRWELERYFEWA